VADVNAVIGQLQALTKLRDLAPGVTSGDVKALQNALVALGFGELTIDGDYGNKTAAAVQNFRDFYSLGSGAFDQTLRTALINDLNAGPNATAVLRALAHGGGVVLPAADSRPKVSAQDLLNAAKQLINAGMQGQPPDLAAVQVALAFLNYFPGSMVGKNDGASQAAYAQALLAFVRVAFGDQSISSTTAVSSAETFRRLGEALQEAVKAQSGSELAVAGGKIKAILTHPATVISAATGLLYFLSVKRTFFGEAEIEDIEDFAGLEDGYGYDFDKDDGEDEDEDEGEDDGADEGDDHDDVPAAIKGIFNGGSLKAFEVRRKPRKSAKRGRRAAMKSRRRARA
jgi:hypothetical protein